MARSDGVDSPLHRFGEAQVSANTFEVFNDRRPDWCFYGFEDNRVSGWWQWVGNSFQRTYLSIEAGIQPDFLSSFLKENLVVDAGHSEQVCVIAVLDGAAECSFHHFDRHRDNGIREAVDLVESKDALFYQHCFHSLEFFGGQFSPKLTAGTGDKGNSRLFQDGIASVFDGDNAAARAIAAALALHRDLNESNVRQLRSCYDQIHARVTIGDTWESAIANLGSARRGETLMDRLLGDHKDCGIEDVVLGAGIRFASATTAMPNVPEFMATRSCAVELPPPDMALHYG